MGLVVGIEGVTTPHSILLTPIIEGRAETERPRVLGFLPRKLVNFLSRGEGLNFIRNPNFWQFRPKLCSNNNSIDQ